MTRREPQFPDRNELGIAVLFFNGYTKK
jgi:hypothetical protein